MAAVQRRLLLGMAIVLQLAQDARGGSCGFVLSGGLGTGTGIYQQTDHFCNCKPTYKRTTGTAYVIFHTESNGWVVGLEERLTDCVATGLMKNVVLPDCYTPL